MEINLEELLNRIKRNKSRQIGLTDKNPEAKTIHSFVLPFLTYLGFDIFDIDDVIPQLHVDGISTLKWPPHIDFGMIIDYELKYMIEVKPRGENLYSHIDQLYSYYVRKMVKISILTDGLNYLIFSDFDIKHRMDKEPFYKFNLAHLKNIDKEFIKYLSKDYYNEEKLLSFKNKKKINLIDDIEKETRDEWIDRQFKDLILRRGWSLRNKKSIKFDIEYGREYIRYIHDLFYSNFNIPILQRKIVDTFARLNSVQYKDGFFTKKLFYKNFRSNINNFLVYLFITGEDFRNHSLIKTKVKDKGQKGVKYALIKGEFNINDNNNYDDILMCYTAKVLLREPNIYFSSDDILDLLIRERAGWRSGMVGRNKKKGKNIIDNFILDSVTNNKRWYGCEYEMKGGKFRNIVEQNIFENHAVMEGWNE